MQTQAYFENIQEYIIIELNSAKSSVLIAVAWFTDHVLFNTLCKLKDKGIKVELLIIDDDINRSSGINYHTLQQKGAQVWMIGSNYGSNNIMHNKFCVIDQSTVINGSYNWTKKAKNNYESITIIKNNPSLALDFTTEFQQIIEKYFGKNAESVILDYSKVCVRLETLKNVILLEDTDDINNQLGKLKSRIKQTIKDNNTDNISDIIINTERKNYGEVVRLINEFTTRFKQLTIYTDSEIAALKLELRSLELQLSSLEDEKAEIEKLLYDFEVRHNIELGELIIKILKLRKEKLQQEAEENPEKEGEYREAEKEFDEFSNNYSSLKNEKIIELDDEERRYIKELFRKASKLCHPDKVTEEQKEEAENVFKELINAYKRNDLKKVKDILTNLERGSFLNKSDTVNKKVKLLILVKQLRVKRDNMEEELYKLKNSETYKIVSTIYNWDEYFDSAKEKLNKQLKHLKIIDI